MLWEQAIQRGSAKDAEKPSTQSASNASDVTIPGPIQGERSPTETTQGNSAPPAGHTVLPAGPGADLIRAVDDFVEQISGMRPDGFVGSSPSVADTAFAARAWEAVRQPTERVRIVSPDTATQAEAVCDVVTHFYGTYLDWIDPEPGDDHAPHFTSHEPAGQDALKTLGIRTAERLRSPLAAFRDRWRELHASKSSHTFRMISSQRVSVSSLNTPRRYFVTNTKCTCIPETTCLPRL